MAAVSNLKNMALCLFGTCLICSAALAGVYAVTAEPIAKANADILKASIGAVLPEGGEISEAKEIEVGGMPSEYYESTKDGEVLGYAVKSTVGGFGGPITIMVGILPGGVVYNTSVMSHTETPGLGAKCTEESFAKQFRNLTVDPVKELAVKKDGGTIDAITASTITSRAYVKAINQAVEAIAKVPMPISGGLENE